MPLWHLRTVRVQRLPGLPAETSCCPRCALVEADDGNDGDGGGGGALSARLAASQGPRAADATLLTCNWLEVSAICHWQWALRLHACCLQLFSLKIIKLKWPVNWLQQQHRGSRGSGEATEFNCDAQSTVELPPPPRSFWPVSLVFGYALPRCSALNSPRNPSRVAASSNYGHSNCNQILVLPINHLWLLDIIASSVQRVHVPSSSPLSTTLCNPLLATCLVWNLFSLQIMLQSAPVYDRLYLPDTATNMGPYLAAVSRPSTY